MCFANYAMRTTLMLLIIRFCFNVLTAKANYLCANITCLCILMSTEKFKQRTLVPCLTIPVGRLLTFN